MSKRTTEDIIGNLYDMIQDARAMPLAMDKCILERDKVLDLLDEIIAQLPVELKQAKTIVESRHELISQAKREAENIIKEAQNQVKDMVSKENITIEAKKRAEQIALDAQKRADQIRKAGNAYIDESLQDAEAVIAKALGEVQSVREKFRTVTEKQEDTRKQQIDVAL